MVAKTGVAIELDVMVSVNMTLQPFPTLVIFLILRGALHLLKIGRILKFSSRLFGNLKV